MRATLCATCGTRLRPAFNNRLRCPLFGSCGRDVRLREHASAVLLGALDTASAA